MKCIIVSVLTSTSRLLLFLQCTYFYSLVLHNKAHHPLLLRTCARVNVCISSDRMVCIVFKSIRGVLLEYFQGKRTKICVLYSNRVLHIQLKTQKSIAHVQFHHYPTFCMYCIYLVWDQPTDICCRARQEREKEVEGFCIYMCYM